VHGDSTGLVIADTSSETDHLQRLRSALGVFQQAAKAACDLDESKLQREAEDAAARCISRITIEEGQARERQRRSEALHGQDPQNAEVT